MEVCLTTVLKTSLQTSLSGLLLKICGSPDTSQMLRSLNGDQKMHLQLSCWLTEAAAAADLFRSSSAVVFRNGVVSGRLLCVCGRIGCLCSGVLEYAYSRFTQCPQRAHCCVNLPRMLLSHPIHAPCRPHHLVHGRTHRVAMRRRPGICMLASLAL